MNFKETKNSLSSYFNKLNELYNLYLLREIKLISNVDCDLII